MSKKKRKPKNLLKDIEEMERTVTKFTFEEDVANANGKRQKKFNKFGFEIYSNIATQKIKQDRKDKLKRLAEDFKKNRPPSPIAF